MIARRHTAVLTMLLLLACGDDPAPPPLARFERPTSLDFVCVINGKVEKRKYCRGRTTGDFALHALVTQSARGEIAAVDLANHKVLDNRRDIPGFTYVAAGELPIAIAVPAEHPWVTYVVDFGGRDIRVLNTQALITPTSGDPTLQVIHLGSGPTKMVLSPDEDALLVTLPNAGTVLWLPINRLTERCTAGDRTCLDGLINEADMVTIDLAGSIDRVVPPAAAPTGDSYQELCKFERAPPAPSLPVTLPASGAAPRPSPAGLAIDAFCGGARECPRRLLVADDASPLIHRIDLDAITPGGNGQDALLPPIVVGVPTSAVAVTPWVPTAVREIGGTGTQYIYAIDATDGSVLVVENGLVLNLDSAPGIRPDRIRLAGGGGGTAPSAVGLAVTTPGFDVNAGPDQYEEPGYEYKDKKTGKPLFKRTPEFEALCEAGGLQDASRLRGVFLAVAMSDGSTRIVDIHDMDLGVAEASTTACGTCSNACRECPSEPIPWMVRNHARLASIFRADEAGVTPPISPGLVLFDFEGDDFVAGIRDNGTTWTPLTPHLACITCDPDLAAVVVGTPGQTTTAVKDAGAGRVDAGTDAGAPGMDRVDAGEVSRDAGADVAEPCTVDKPLLCSAADPWTASEERWAITYEGVIKGASGGQGLFELVPAKNPAECVPQLTAEIDFCSLGVLGEDDISASYAQSDCEKKLPPLRGDQLVITAKILGKAGPDVVGKTGACVERGVPDSCAKLRDDVLENPASGIAFNIRRAYGNRLIVDNWTTAGFGKSYPYAEVIRCIGTGPLSFQVRTLDSFAVEGSQTGFQHRVVADANGRCVVDPKANPLQQGRARMGCAFRNQSIAFRFEKFDETPVASEPPPGLRMNVQTRSPATKLLFDASRGASVVPTQLQYNDIDQRLYLLDAHVLGLIPISLDRFPYVDPRDNYR